MSRSLGEIFQKIQTLKTTVESKRTELAGRHVKVESASGIKIVASCDKQIVSIDLGKNMPLEPDEKAELEKKLLTALNETLKEAEKIQKEEANKALGDLGINLPGLF